MAVNLKGRSFLSIMDFTPQEVRYLLDLAHDLKSKKRAGIHNVGLAGKNIVLLFEKSSTRTRCAFEVAALDEGAHVTFLDANSAQMGNKESLEDTAKVLGRYYDGIEYRGYDQEIVADLAKYSGVPVWNGLTDVDHPTQSLADIMTIEEYVQKPLNKIKLVFCGDTRNNVAYCLMYICAKLGIDYVGFGPRELKAAPEVVKSCEEAAKRTSAGATTATFTLTDDPAALIGADAIYTDIWASMGEEAKIPERVKLLTPFRVTPELMAKTKNPECIFLHCLPSFHDFNTTMAQKQMDLGYDIREVTDEVFQSDNSRVFDQAENRMHTIKAVMLATMG
jgi:ornithine carbamoyltransferase